MRSWPAGLALVASLSFVAPRAPHLEVRRQFRACGRLPQSRQDHGALAQLAAAASRPAILEATAAGVCAALLMALLAGPLDRLKDRCLRRRLHFDAPRRGHGSLALLLQLLRFPAFEALLAGGTPLALAGFAALTLPLTNLRAGLRDRALRGHPLKASLELGRLRKPIIVMKSDRFPWIRRIFSDFELS